MEKPSDASGVRSSQDSAAPKTKRGMESWVTNKCHKRKRERGITREKEGEGGRWRGQKLSCPFIQFLPQPGMNNTLWPASPKSHTRTQMRDKVKT